MVIPGDMLVEKDGYYQLKIKNELDEIDYIDNLVLQIVDHPMGTKIALNDFVRGTKPYKIYTFSEDACPLSRELKEFYVLAAKFYNYLHTLSGERCIGFDRGWSKESTYLR